MTTANRTLLRRAALVAALPILIPGGKAHAQQVVYTSADSSATSISGPSPIFYRPDLNFGSVSVMGPLNVLFNRGFSLLHFRDQPRDIREVQWGNGFSAVVDALTHPQTAIDRAGG